MTCGTFPRQLRPTSTTARRRAQVRACKRPSWVCSQLLQIDHVMSATCRLHATVRLRVNCADELEGMDVTAGNESPWHAAKPAQVPLSDACDAAGGGDALGDYSPVSEEAGGSMSPQSDGWDGFPAAPPPLVYEPVMVPWGHGAPRCKPQALVMVKGLLSIRRVVSAES